MAAFSYWVGGIRNNNPISCHSRCSCHHRFWRRFGHHARCHRHRSMHTAHRLRWQAAAQCAGTDISDRPHIIEQRQRLGEYEGIRGW